MVLRRLLSFSLFILACSLMSLVVPGARAQSLGNAGTIEGSVTDQTGASIPALRLPPFPHQTLLGHRCDERAVAGEYKSPREAARAVQVG